MKVQTNEWKKYAEYAVEMGRHEECIRSGIPVMDHIAQIIGEPNGYIEINAGFIWSV